MVQIFPIFHKCSKDISNNIILIKTKENQRFGGFTINTWIGRENSISESEAFCFSLSNKKIYNRINNDTYPSTVWDCNEYLSFYDMFTLGNNKLLNKGNCSNSNSNRYEQTKKFEINNGKEYFLVDELEFYQVSFE
ncbi:hypothetical protein LY90DRAFT_511492 [Neocallimastix californiae]|jgi:hypothetical protein|uniref:TLDc domain-containing protein n=1 Tax=Neocallimastix californiae TaxID=1754190 RepID=A0A1Y2BR21_9FUNG|nr:hypothetical protein LY90DRAFT_511492 [Neocallimastix californiae]|eukprot:ORY36595.1 hypothetical protein LY90DRAFT_511492 [Neocallimastix californiae]